MKPTVPLYLGFASTSFANILFSHPPLDCNITSLKIYHGCFRGQTCVEDIGCVPNGSIIYPLPTTVNVGSPSFRTGHAAALVVDGPYSTNGFCGPKYGNTICDPNSTAYQGGCCSQHGFCGNTADHCSTGCISGCTATGGAVPRADGQCGKQNGDAGCDPKGPYGGCCSQYGFCGSTPGHCLIPNGCQSGCTGGTPTSTPRGDGQCGASVGGATCDPKGPYGGCCSRYGFCGNAEGHCSVKNGCQSGCTDGTGSSNNEPTINPSGGTVTGGPVTTDGTCGSSNGNTVCGNWPKGNCCSAYGFCGNTDGHCGAGCQSGGCLGAPAIAVPGPSPAPEAPNQGIFYQIGQSGVPAMHAALMPNGRVIMLDKLENYTQLKTSDGMYAMSSEFDADPQSPTYGQVVPLYYQSNAFCSGGTFLPDGTLISIGGNAPLTWLNDKIKDGFRAVRFIRRAIDGSLDGRDWTETNQGLASARWYATAQTLPDGSIFVASGSLNGLDPSIASNNNPTYEILDRNGVSQGQNIPLDILQRNQPYYMYPFVHLLKDGNLFIFVAKSCQLYNVPSRSVVRDLPGLPGDFRTYPNTGGSVLLPLSSKNGYEPEVLICGGGSYQDITSPTDASCGRIAPLVPGSQWTMESMPEGRGMVEGVLLPDGKVLWVNGGSRGAQGFGLMSNPTLEALLYDPDQPLGKRWTIVGRTDIPRLYHSVALLMPDATVMIAGSNPVQMPKLQPDAQDPYATEFRVEQFRPPYFAGSLKYQPSGLRLESSIIHADGSTFPLSFNAGAANVEAGDIKIMLYHCGFVTHSLHMGHRMVQLDIKSGFTPGSDVQNIIVIGPPNNAIAPPGPYWVYVVVRGVPAKGVAVQVV